MRLGCLIVDDNHHFLAAAGQLLESEGIRIVGVGSTGDEAVARVAELRPDVVLLDIDLGEESGFDVAERLATLPTGAPPVILISTHSGSDFAELITSSSAVGFVSKSELSASAIEHLLRAA
jgi:CheY-like chemotaxis protein